MGLSSYCEYIPSVSAISNTSLLLLIGNMSLEGVIVITSNKKNKNKTRIDRLPSEAKDQLTEYIEDLIDDADRYDHGELKKIKRSSVILRSLYYDTKFSHSLLKQIGDKEYIKMDSYSNNKNENDVYYGNIFTASFEIRSKKKYLYTFLFHPTKEHPKRIIHFDNWLNGNVITLANTQITRKEVIRIMANQDGGAHFDPKIDNVYSKLQRGKIGWQYDKMSKEASLFLFGTPDESPKSPEHIENAIMRQIVHETITSLIRWYKLPIEYNPDFEFLWQRKLNRIGFQFTATQK